MVYGQRNYAIARSIDYVLHCLIFDLHVLHRITSAATIHEDGALICKSLDWICYTVWVTSCVARLHVYEVWLHMICLHCCFTSFACMSMLVVTPICSNPEFAVALGYIYFASCLLVDLNVYVQQLPLHL
jgi:hypothetical protein